MTVKEFTTVGMETMSSSYLLILKFGTGFSAMFSTSVDAS